MFRRIGGYIVLAGTLALPLAGCGTIRAGTGCLDLGEGIGLVCVEVDDADGDGELDVSVGFEDGESGRVEVERTGKALGVRLP